MVLICRGWHWSGRRWRSTRKVMVTYSIFVDDFTCMMTNQPALTDIVRQFANFNKVKWIWYIMEWIFVPNNFELNSSVKAIWHLWVLLWLRNIMDSYCIDVNTTVKHSHFCTFYIYTCSTHEFLCKSNFCAFNCMCSCIDEINMIQTLLLFQFHAPGIEDSRASSCVTCQA